MAEGTSAAVLLAVQVSRFLLMSSSDRIDLLLMFVRQLALQFLQGFCFSFFVLHLSESERRGCGDRVERGSVPLSVHSVLVHSVLCLLDTSIQVIDSAVLQLVWQPEWMMKIGWTMLFLSLLKPFVHVPVSIAELKLDCIRLSFVESMSLRRLCFVRDAFVPYWRALRRIPWTLEKSIRSLALVKREPHLL